MPAPPLQWPECPKCHQRSGAAIEPNFYQCEVCGHTWKLPPEIQSPKRLK